MSFIPDVLLDVDAADLAARLKHARSQLHTTKSGSAREVLEHNLSAEEIARLRTAEPVRTIDELNDRLEAAEAEVAALPTIVLTVARPVRARFQRQLTEWFERNGIGPAKLTFTVDPAIVGGVVFGIAGRRYDYSVLKELATTNVHPTSDSGEGN